MKRVIHHTNMKERLLDKKTKARKAYIRPSLNSLLIKKNIGFVCVSDGFARGEYSDDYQMLKYKDFDRNEEDEDDEGDSFC